MVTLLSGAIYLTGVIPAVALTHYATIEEYEKGTGKKIEKFEDAPMLRIKVAAGEIPPLNERLPKDIAVVEPLEEIGQYGGTAIVFTERVSPGDAMFLIGQVPILRLAPDCKTIIPNIAKGWKLSKDGKTLTLYFRKGMKWSDGYPFTVDDILFWWEDIIMNDELTPVKPSFWFPGQKTEVEKLDDYTIRFHFDVPYPSVVVGLALSQGMNVGRPKHYLKQFHIKYNPEAVELAKKKGFVGWYSYFADRNKVDHGLPVNPDLPTLFPFRLVERTPEYWLYERNPYFWEVDTEGNQLPYIDRVLSRKVSNLQVYNGKIISGEADYAIRGTSPDKYPLYMENAEKGNYRVLPWVTGYASAFNYTPNQTCEDPVLRKIFQDVRFRRALSLAINREEINETVYLGLGQPTQMAPLPISDYYEERFAKAYAEYDPDEANRLLDEMGLEWDKNHEYRLRPDGKILSWVTEYCPWVAFGSIGPASELVKEYWKAIGCKVIFKEERAELLSERRQANKVEMDTHWGDRCAHALVIDPHHFVLTGKSSWGREWYRWYISKGEEGIEPPEEVKRNREKWERMRITTNNEERIRLGKEIAESQAENLWEIGVVGRIPKPLIVRNNLRNVVKTSTYTSEVLDTTPSIPEQYFFKHQ